MFKVRLIRGNKQGMVNKQHKGEFIKEFKNTSELARLLAGTNRVYIADIKDIPKSERKSLVNKFGALKREKANT